MNRINNKGPKMLPCGFQVMKTSEAIVLIITENL